MRPQLRRKCQRNFVETKSVPMRTKTESRERTWRKQGFQHASNPLARSTFALRPEPQQERIGFGFATAVQASEGTNTRDDQSVRPAAERPAPQRSFAQCGFQRKKVAH